MKFWQKIFVSSILLFLILFDAGTYFIIKDTYQISLQREMQGSVREEELIFASVNQEMKNIDALESKLLKDEKVLQSIMSPLAEYYKELGVRIALYKNEKEIYSNIEKFDFKALEKKPENDTVVQNKKIGGKRTIYVASKSKEYPDFIFLYARDVSSLDKNLEHSTHTFWLVSIGVMILLGMGNYLILYKLTRPIKELNNTAKKIAKGSVSERVAIKSRDELGELAESFNKMADSLEQKLDKLNQAANEKQNFIDNMAHEMRTPLTSILGYSEILRNKKASEEDKQLACEYIFTAANQIARLQVKLMELTGLESEEEEFTSIDVITLGKKIQQLMNYSLKERKLTLKMHIEPVSLMGNEPLLLSLLTNLVENAARASKEGSIIGVSIYKEESVVFKVRDYGCGIPEEEINRITEPFYRVDKSRSRENGGVGLGMSLVSKIAKIHNADLIVESEIGTGTTISVVFTTI